MFITFEGIDGAGKSTHWQMLFNALCQMGIDCIATREPGGTDLGEHLRHLILTQEMSSLAEALLLFAGRDHHVQTVIQPALAAGRWVLSDRFIDASFAYQGGGRGFDEAILQQLTQWVLPSDCMPHVTLWFDVDPLLAAQRLAQTNKQPDRFESQQVTFFERVRQGYAKRVADDPKRFIRMDANGTSESVWEQVWQTIGQIALKTQRTGWTSWPSTPPLRQP